MTGRPLLRALLRRLAAALVAARALLPLALVLRGCALAAFCHLAAATEASGTGLARVGEAATSIRHRQNHRRVPTGRCSARQGKDLPTR